jgi:hypothetical protein
MVLYNGKKEWDVPQRFKEIIDGSDLFGDSVIDFKYSIFDVNNNYTKEDLIKNKNITSAIFLLDQKIDAEEFIERIKAIALFFANLTDKERMVLKHWIGNTVETEIAETAKNLLDVVLIIFINESGKSMSKFSNLLSMLILLKSRGKVKVKELSEALEVTERMQSNCYKYKKAPSDLNFKLLNHVI